jgi:cytochrome b561
MNQYHITQRKLHWVTVLIVMTTAPLGLFMDDFPGQMMFYAAYLHLSLGIILWFVIAVRWRLHIQRPRPCYPVAIGRGSIFFAKAVQYSMLALLTVQPLIGLVFFYYYPPELWGQDKTPLVMTLYELHEKIAYAFAALLSLHVLGFIKHLLIDKTNLLGRIL